ncbi:MAG TPA: PilN domain-containing protein [Fimbriimonadaceae bacterium]|nr:PilN domain-containing protein [Fimbriimonadaceae bacterium]
MSRKNVAPAAVVAWSTSSVSWVDEGHRLSTTDSLMEAAAMLPTKDVLIATSRRSTFIRTMRVPNASKPDIRRILQVQIGQLFPIPANELSFDFHLTQDVNSEGRLAVIAAIRSADLQILHSQAKAAGLRITGVLPAALGSAALAKSLHQPDAAVVHRTAEGLAIDLVAGGELRYSRVAPDPANALGIEAEVSRTFAAALMSCSPTIAAGALALPDTDVSTDTWGLETLPTAHLDINIQTPEQMARALRQAEIGKIRLATVLMGLAVVALTAQTLNYVDAAKKASSADARWRKKIGDAKSLQDAEQKKADVISGYRDVVDLAFHPAQSLSDVLAIVTNDAPKGVWLTGFTLERGKALTIRGTAANSNAVQPFTDAIRQEADKKTGQLRFRDTTIVFSSSSEIDNTPVTQFSVSTFPVGNLPLEQPDIKKVGQK